ncbi:MAG TPA: ATP-binding cassette domain-containing protein [Tepidisphaeraceae bacterium]|jgi:ABC-2 type transport system ATP-binding protein|nr:ATP-binding cassette domain-containing protein [Tepidisphaeraceae bacterium]
MTNHIEISRLTHRYGQRVAVDDLTLNLEAGKIFGFLGPNGSGKTTLFRILATLLPVAPGHVRVLGIDVAGDRDQIRKQIGVVFQSPSLDKQLTAAENLTYQGHLYGLRGADLRSRVESALAAVGLDDRAAERVERFSGGMRRRVEVAKGLLHRPRLLLLDEPSTGLDPSARIDMWRQLRHINHQDGVTILLTTHLMEEAERCTNLAVVATGKLLAADTPAALKERIGGDVVTIVSDRVAELKTLLRDRLGVEAGEVDGALRIERARGHEFIPQLIESAPGMIDSVSVGKPTLEDVFIQLTGHRLDAELASSRQLMRQ